MTKANVIKIRDSLMQKGQAIMIYCDNSNLFNNQIHFLVWDDTNELLYVFKASSDQYNQDKAPVEMVVTSYELIEFIYGMMDKVGLDKVLSEMVTSNLISADKKKMVMNFAGSITNFPARSPKAEGPYYTEEGG